MQTDPTKTTEAQPGGSQPASGDLLYRFEGRLTQMNPVGVLPEGLRLAVPFEGTVSEGPLAGALVWGIDQFLLRPDGVGVLDAPETFSRDDLHVIGQVRGYALPPDGMLIPPLQDLLDPNFAWPEQSFRITGAVTFRSASPDLDWMNRTIAVIAGSVNLGTGRLEIEARAA